MASLPTKAELTGNGVTKGNFKARLEQIVDYLTDLLGTTGVDADARTALGAAAQSDMAAKADVTYVDALSGVTVRQTAQFGAVNTDGYANFLSAGAGLRLSLAATAVALALSFANGAVEGREVISSDNADILGSDLPASNTSYVYKTLGGAWGSTLVAPQYGYAFDKTKGALLNFEGADAATSTTDDFGNTFTFVGNAQIDTAQFKFGTSSLRVDGVGSSSIDCGSISSLGDGSWEISLWFRASAWPGVGQEASLLAACNASDVGLDIRVVNDAGNVRVRAYASGDGTTQSIISGATGTAAGMAAGVWHRVRMVFDALGGTYKVYLSQNGAAETLEISSASTARVCGNLTRFRLGANADAAGALFNGWIDAFRFIPCATNTGIETPSAVAPSITDHPVHFFSIPEMKMYEVASASASAGTNPGMTQRNRVFLGEADTGAATVSAVRAYALRGSYVSAPFTWTTGTLNSQSHNIGVKPDDVELQLVCQTADAGYKPGESLDFSHTIYRESSVAQTGWAVSVDRTVVGTTAASSVYVVPNKTAGSAVTLTVASWKLRLTLKRGW